jgi:hypothetical protein
VDVVHVDQQTAAGATRDLGQEVDLVPVVARHRQIGRWVLDQQPAPQSVLRFVDVAADQRQHFAAARNGQQVRVIDPAPLRPGQVLGHHEGLEAVDQGAISGQMLAIRAFVPGQGQADPMQGQRPARTDALQPGQARPARDHVVLGVDLEPQAVLGADRRAGLGLGVVLGLQTQPGGRCGGHQRFGIGLSEPLPLGVLIAVQVPRGVSFQALP